MNKATWILSAFLLSATALFAGLNQQDFFGPQVYDQNGDSTQSETLSAKIYGIYFSAHWCPPCRKFSPVLVDAYNEIKKNGGEFEIIFVSGDHSEEAQFNYMTELNMPWYTVKHNGSAAANLMQKYAVRGIPALIIIDADGNLITDNGRQAISRHGAKAYETWLKKNQDNPSQPE